MKKILSILLLFISVAAISQPSNYLNIRSRYNLIAVKTDSGFHVPGYSTIPNYRSGFLLQDEMYLIQIKESIPKRKMNQATKMIFFIT